jgi:heat shock protein HslJ
MYTLIAKIMYRFSCIVSHIVISELFLLSSAWRPAESLTKGAAALFRSNWLSEGIKPLPAKSLRIPPVSAIPHRRRLNGCKIIFLLIAAAVVSACSGGSAVRSNRSFADVQDMDWILAEIKTASGTVLMDRQKMESVNLGEAYTLRFGPERLTGIGAPNRFTGPYTAGEGRSLSIGPAAATQMMSLVQPEGLTEREFFGYLDRVASWNLRRGLLELNSSSESGGAAVLVFSLR